MKSRKPSTLACRLCVLALLLPGCSALKKTAGTDKPSPPVSLPAPGIQPINADASALLSMSFQEASSIAGQHVDVPYLPKVAADNIEVLRKFADGKPRKIRAKGRVFIEIENQDHAHALCDEALIDGGDIILRGKPILQRGPSTVEGLSNVTTFYLLGTNLKVIGQHRLTNLKQLAGSAPWSQSGVASLLPPLDSSDVPAGMRDEMRRAAEAEAQLQKSRMGAAPAFPQPPPGGAAPEKVEKPGADKKTAEKKSSDKATPDKKAGAQ